MRTINDKFARTVTKPGMYRADDTLYLLVKPSGRRSWVQRIMVDGRRYNLGLGGYPVVTLTDAKVKALENRRKVDRGQNLLAVKIASAMPSFEQAARRYHDDQTWTEARGKQFLQAMGKHVFPAIGSVKVDTITQKHVLGILSPIWTEKPHQAQRTRNFMRRVFDYCIAHEFITTANPAGDAIKAALPTVKTSGNNYRSLDYKELPEAVRTIETGVTSLPCRLALLFTIYTGSRAGEARAAAWSEIDFDSSTWTIPGEKMKSGKPHRVPLSASALEILELARPLRNPSGLIFPSAQNPHKPMTPQAMLKNLRKVGLGDKTVSHGFRASFKTWATEETEVDPAVIECALAHVIGSTTEQAYFRGELFEKRRALMQSWADYITGQGE